MELYNEQDIQWMKSAIQLSGTSVFHNKLFGGPFGAIVVKDGKPIGLSFNQVEMDKDPTAHAEVMAIRDACKNLQTSNLRGCKLYTSCEPCPMCLFAIQWAGIHQIYYAATRDDAEKIGFQDSQMYKKLNEDNFTGVPIKECRDEAVNEMNKWKEKFSDWEYK